MYLADRNKIGSLQLSSWVLSSLFERTHRRHFLAKCAEQDTALIDDTLSWLRTIAHCFAGRIRGETIPPRCFLPGRALRHR
jgi:hypothetical protein